MILSVTIFRCRASSHCRNACTAHVARWCFYFTVNLTNLTTKWDEQTFTHDTKALNRSIRFFSLGRHVHRSRSVRSGLSLSHHMIVNCHHSMARCACAYAISAHMYMWNSYSIYMSRASITQRSARCIFHLQNLSLTFFISNLFFTRSTAKLQTSPLVCSVKL